MTGLEHDIKELKDHYERQGSLFPAGTQKDVDYKKWYLKQLDQIYYKYKHLEGTNAQSALVTLSIQRRALEKSLPGWFKGIRRYMRQLSTSLLGNKTEKRVIAQQSVGHQRVLYQLREAGLGKMIDQAEKAMKNGIPEFSLSASQEVAADKSFTAQVRFVKDDAGRYGLSYKGQMQTAGKDGMKVQWLDNEENGLLTNERAINLLSGGAIMQPYYVQGKQHSEWLLLDQSDVNANGAAKIKRFDTAFSYDLSSALDNLTAKGLLSQQPKETIMRQLENGNQVKFLLSGLKGERPVRIAADPVGKDLIFYDQQGKQITKEKALGKITAQSSRIRIPLESRNRSLKIHR